MEDLKQHTCSEWYRELWDTW